MKYSQAALGRIFIIRLEHKERLPQVIDAFCDSHNIKRGFCLFVGGIRKGGDVVVGPENEDDVPPNPLLHKLKGTHEIVGVGTIFPDKNGKPVLHAHASLGRQGKAVTGCIRPGIDTWKVVEVILLELESKQGARLMDNSLGLALLDPKAGF